MNTIIRWLREVEHLASEAYDAAALKFAAETELAPFLRTLAEEEAWHYHVMGSGLALLDDGVVIEPEITVDNETATRIAAYFVTLKNRVVNDTLTREALLESVVEAELSEWNDIFLYAVRVLKENSDEFVYPAARLQTHVKAIEHYLTHHEKRPDILEKIKKLPAIWVENILIAEDNQMIAELIRSLLNREGNIDVVPDGTDALDLIKTQYYKLIITDINMPVMDGFTLYEKAAAEFPGIGSRFLFISGNLSPEKRDYLEQRGLSYLAKPMAIRELRDICSRILLNP